MGAEHLGLIQMNISVGIIDGGPEATGSRIDRAVLLAMNLIADEIGDPELGVDPEVNVVFHLPGSICPNEFYGIRTGRLSRKQKLLMVQVGVHEDQLEAPDAERLVWDWIREACQLAFTRFHKSGFEFDLQRTLDLVDRLSTQIE